MAAPLSNLSFQMPNRALLKLGPPPPHDRETTLWIALAQPGFQSAGDHILGQECETLAELELLAVQIRGDLDSILIEARHRVAAKERGR